MKFLIPATMIAALATTSFPQAQARDFVITPGESIAIGRDTVTCSAGSSEDQIDVAVICSGDDLNLSVINLRNGSEIKESFDTDSAEECSQFEIQINRITPRLRFSGVFAYCDGDDLVRVHVSSRGVTTSPTDMDSADACKQAAQRLNR